MARNDRSTSPDPRSRPRGRVTKRRSLNPVDKTARNEPPDDYPALVRAAAGGDELAMERLLMRAQEVAWRFSLAVCGRPDDAEDAMQEALIKTYRYTGQIRDPGAFRPWLYRTVKNACLISRRKRVHEPHRVESLDAPVLAGSMAYHNPTDPGRNPEQLAVSGQQRRDLQAAVRALPAAYRGVFVLREMEGLSTRDVAAVLEISEDSVKTRLRRARVALQQILAKDRR